jgi:hypothetical protein
MEAVAMQGWVGRVLGNQQVWGPQEMGLRWWPTTLKLREEVRAGESSERFDMK